MATRAKKAAPLVRVGAPARPHRTPGCGSAEAATVIVDGRPVEYAPVGDDYPADLIEVETVEPVTYEEGPERCGFGPATVTGGLIRVYRGGQSRSDYYRATEAGGSEWSNYGAPHGTRITLCVKWVPWVRPTGHTYPL